jgi:hypothetical protein
VRAASYKRLSEPRHVHALLSPGRTAALTWSDACPHLVGRLLPVGRLPARCASGAPCARLICCSHRHNNRVALRRLDARTPRQQSRTRSSARSFPRDRLITPTRRRVPQGRRVRVGRSLDRSYLVGRIVPARRRASPTMPPPDPRGMMPLKRKVGVFAGSLHLRTLAPSHPRTFRSPRNHSSRAGRPPAGRLRSDPASALRTEDDDRRRRGRG